MTLVLNPEGISLPGVSGQCFMCRLNTNVKMEDFHR